MCQSVRELLADQGCQLESAGSGREALRRLAEGGYELVLLDLVLPDMSGQDVLAFIREHHPELLTIVISGVSSIDAAVAALQRGAYDYIRKPVEGGGAAQAGGQRAGAAAPGPGEGGHPLGAGAVPAQVPLPGGELAGPDLHPGRAGAVHLRQRRLRAPAGVPARGDDRPPLLGDRPSPRCGEVALRVQRAAHRRAGRLAGWSCACAHGPSSHGAPGFPGGGQGAGHLRPGERPPGQELPGDLRGGPRPARAQGPGAPPAAGGEDGGGGPPGRGHRPRLQQLPDRHRGQHRPGQDARPAPTRRSTPAWSRWNGPPCGPAT